MKSSQREFDLKEDTAPSSPTHEKMREIYSAARGLWRRMNKRRLLAVVGTALLGIGLLILPRFINRPVERKNAAAQLQYTPAGLINDLETRLAYLQSRTSVVSFYIHTIKSRENLWKLATKRHYSVHSIIGCNPQFETYEVDIKQRIIIPSKPGTLHVVQPGDNWDKIAKRYKTNVNELIKYNPWAGSPAKGDMVFIPDRRPDMDLMNDKMREKYELRALFVSPLGGRLTSVFGMRRHPVTGQRSMHGGIDIAVREGTWVGAAADGVVTLASGGVGHYGKAVFIEHENGYITHYGHLSSIRVRVGQKVKARQLIAKSGSTGRSTGPHLHFTIKKNGANKDPLKFIW
ncbi:MAG: M23 family metallopeptidase [Elusimicrobiota bacterium]